jgi:hypothetical protein
MYKYLLALTAILFVLIISGCGAKEASNENMISVMDFSNLYSITENGKDVSDDIRKLNGKTVKIQGFMAEQSLVDNSFIYLVNKPYTVCPFCVIYDNTKLDVISIYMEDDSPIEFTNQPVEIIGTLEVEPKVDVFNYTTQFRIHAKKISNIKDFIHDKEVMAYFQQMNQKNIIAALQIAFVNINHNLYPDLLNDESLTVDEKYKSISEKLNIEFITQGIGVMKKNLDYIKTIKPSNNNVKKIHDELIMIFEEIVVLLEDIDKVNYQITNLGPSNKDEKEKILSDLLNLYERNKSCFDKFTLWNDSMR